MEKTNQPIQAFEDTFLAGMRAKGMSEEEIAETMQKIYEGAAVEVVSEEALTPSGFSPFIKP